MAVLNVRFAFCVFDVYIDVFDGRYDCQGNMLGWGKKCHKGNFMMKIFLFIFVLINFQLSVKNFSVPPCYLMKGKDKVEKRWILTLTLNFEGEPSDTASTFFKMASADGYFLYEEYFDAVITMSDY